MKSEIRKLDERVERLASQTPQPETSFSGEILAQDLKKNLEDLAGTPQAGCLLEAGDVAAVEAVILKARRTECKTSREFVSSLDECERSALTNLICEVEHRAGSWKPTQLVDGIIEQGGRDYAARKEARYQELKQLPALSASEEKELNELEQNRTRIIKIGR